MTVVPFPLSPQQEFRALIGFVLMDDAIIVTAHLKDQLACDADSADPQEEIDGSASVLEFVRPLDEVAADPGGLAGVEDRDQRFGRVGANT